MPVLNNNHRGATETSALLSTPPAAAPGAASIYSFTSLNPQLEYERDLHYSYKQRTKHANLINIATYAISLLFAIYLLINYSTALFNIPHPIDNNDIQPTKLHYATQFLLYWLYWLISLQLFSLLIDCACFLQPINKYVSYLALLKHYFLSNLWFLLFLLDHFILYKAQQNNPQMTQKSDTKNNNNNNNNNIDDFSSIYNEQSLAQIAYSNNYHYLVLNWLLLAFSFLANYCWKIIGYHSHSDDY
jgi:hypothetical protein